MRNSLVLYVLVFGSCLMIKIIRGNPMYMQTADNEVDVPPMGTCRQECAGYNIGCPPSHVCCNTGCGHICQKGECPRVKLTPYPFCRTKCHDIGPNGKSYGRAYCLCYNACMNVRCAKEEICVPKQPKCGKETCLPLGVCINANKFLNSELGALNLPRDDKDYYHDKMAFPFPMHSST